MTGRAIERAFAASETGGTMSNLSETQFVEKLRGEPGRYVLHEMGTCTLRERTAA
jgi:hypothetical protein